MGKLLNADKTLEVFIVAHTDNQGAVDANVSLPQRRADKDHRGETMHQCATFSDVDEA